MSSPALTLRIRQISTWAWCLGLATIALDFLFLPLFGERVSVSYLFFCSAAFLMAWAEKREFSTRVFFYRLHDSVIYSPWRFLLLYFLWISIFSPFTEHPLKSILYAANGWLSLFAVGLTAQFLFCERSEAGVILLPSRLSLAFRAYALTLVLLFANQLLHLFFPELPLKFLLGEQLNLFLYFLIGLPYLFWDFLKQGRHLLPRWLAGLTLVLGGATTILIGRKFFTAALIICLGALLLLFVYKKIRLRRAIALTGAIACAGIFALVFLKSALLTSMEWTDALHLARVQVAERMGGGIETSLAILERTQYLGQGLGLAPLRGVWVRVIAEAGVIGFLLYAAFFVNLLWDLFQVRRSSRVVVSNISFLSVGVFLLLASHYIGNPYGAYVWVWYSIWSVFAATHKKKKV
jgi:hypothetical protein